MAQQYSYELTAGALGAGDLRVHALSGRERLNDAYEFLIEVVCSDLDRDVERQILGASARLSIEIGTERRVFHGVIRAVDALGVITSELREHAHFRVELVPRLWLLTQQRNSRVFQDLTIPDIVRQVLGDSQVTSGWLLRHPHPKRELCIQYEETDYDFVTRLLAESGIFFFFAQPPVELGDVANMIAQGIGQVTSMLGPLGGMLSSATPLPTGEIVMMADDAMFYPPLDESPEHLMSALQSQFEQVARTYVGDALVSKVSEQFQSLGIASPAGALRYRPDADALAAGDRDLVRSFARKGRVRPLAAAFRDVDPRRPHAPMSFQARAQVGAGSIIGDIAAGVASLIDGDSQSALQQVAQGVGQLAGAAVSGVLSEPTAGNIPFEIYDHHIHHLFPDWRTEEREPQRMLAAARRDADEATGRSNCTKLAAGHRFRLEDHPIGRFNADYAVVEVTHRGRGYEHTAAIDEPVYQNHFRCVPSTVPYVPEKPKRRTVQTCLTATVVGTDEIHAVDYTMIKVKFHWDRRGLRQNTTCWIRCMQAWAGAHWGTQFVPREGMEVVVGFDGGDVDKPIVLGCVYNGIHPPPFPLPESRTRSGIRTRTTPGGHTGNELSFDDAADHQQIFLHAERDLDIVVENDRTMRVQHDDRNEIAGSQTWHVFETQETRVDGDRRVTVVGADQLDVRQTLGISVAGNRTTSVYEDDRLNVRGSRHDEIRGGMSSQVQGDRTDRIAGARTEMVGTHGAPRSRAVRVEGTSTLSSSGTNAVTSEEEVILQCGASHIRIASDRIELCSKEIRLAADGARIKLASDEARITAEARAQIKGHPIVLKAQSAGLALTAEAAMEGSRILLNSPTNAEDAPDEDTVQPTRIELQDDDGNPIPYARYRITLSSGGHVTGVLGGNGQAEIDLDEDGELSFPELGEVDSA
jgi:type VI secretion system secreted protein VgrG